MPENYHGNQLKSYGGYLKYTVRHEGQGNPVSAPDVILSVSSLCVNLVFPQRILYTNERNISRLEVHTPFICW